MELLEHFETFQEAIEGHEKIWDLEGKTLILVDGELLEVRRNPTGDFYKWAVYIVPEVS